MLPQQSRMPVRSEKSKRAGKKAPPPASGPATAADDSDDEDDRTFVKTPEQLNFLTSHWPAFLTHQNARTLDRLWPRVYDGWYKKWPIVVSSKAVRRYGSQPNAILARRVKKNKSIRTWYHNQARPTSKSSKSDLRLDQNEKRKLAPAQAYCAYAWDSGLKEIVTARWNEEQSNATVGGGLSAATSNPSISIDYKLKISKEIYDGLPPAEKKQIDDRRERDWRRMYQPIWDIEDAAERDDKLALHEHNQRSVPKSLTRVLKNLEGQAGCIAHLLVAYVNPRDGSASVQNYCQGGTEDQNFRTFCGDDWDNVIEKRFKEWAMDVFGESRSTERGKYIFTNAPPVSQATASGSTVTLVEESDETLIIASDAEGELVEASANTTQPPRVDMIEAAPLEASTSTVGGQQPAPDLESSGSGLGSPASPQTSQPVEFVSPQEIFGLDMSVRSIAKDTFANHLPTVPSFLVPPPVLVPTPVLDSRRVDPVNPVVLESPSNTFSPTSETVASHQVPISLMTPGVVHPDYPPLVLNPPQSIIPQHAARPPVRELPVSSERPPVARVAKAIDLVLPSGGNPETINVVKSTWRARDQTGSTHATQSRRNSIEGAPEVILTLIGSGYERPQPSAPPSSTSPLDGFIVPSSQQSLEEVLSIPTSPSISPSNQSIVASPQQSLEDSMIHTETNTSAPDTLLVREIAEAPPQQSLDGAITLPKQPYDFPFAPRIIPNYGIDKSDLPSWLLERGRLDSVLYVEAGGMWEKLITTWLQQERRLGFGLDEKIGVNLPLTKKPKILREYFKWHHNPSKGDSIILPEFRKEVELWWSSIQPKWRYKEEVYPYDEKDYSFILAGGKKGAFLLILCLAWWDRAHSRNLERLKDERRAAAQAAEDDTPLDFSDLPDHDCSWFNILNDLILVLELAQRSPVPTKAIPATSGVGSGRKKRAAEEETTSPRKKKRSS